MNYAGTSSAREWSRLETNYENLSSQLSQSLRSRIDWTKSGAIKVRDEHRARHPQVQISTSANVTDRRTDGQADKHRVPAIPALMHSIARQKGRHIDRESSEEGNPDYS